MTKREAKTTACRKAATILQNVIHQNVWQHLDDLPVKDQRRIMSALDEIIEELFRRGKE